MDRVMNKWCKRVARGVKFLEERPEEFGYKWFNVIDTEKLNLKDVEKCILGQLYAPKGRTYYEACVYLQINDSEQHRMGFDITIDDQDTDENYTKLTKAWKRAINYYRNKYLRDGGFFE